MGNKSKYELEYTLKTSLYVLYQRLSTAEGLSEWFADEVKVEGDIFTFIWQGTEARAKMISAKDNKSVHFEWLEFLDDETNSFEFRIFPNDLTGDSTLIITDYAENEEKDDAIYLWDTQVSRLKKVLGISE